jgi:hypothetical protein
MKLPIFELDEFIESTWMKTQELLIKNQKIEQAYQAFNLQKKLSSLIIMGLGELL